MMPRKYFAQCLANYKSQNQSWCYCISPCGFTPLDLQGVCAWHREALSSACCSSGPWTEEWVGGWLGAPAALSLMQRKSRVMSEGFRLSSLFLGHIRLVFLGLPEPSPYLPGAQVASILGSLSKLWAGVGLSALNSICAQLSKCKKLLREIILVICIVFSFWNRKQEMQTIELGEGETTSFLRAEKNKRELPWQYHG